MAPYGLTVKRAEKLREECRGAGGREGDDAASLHEAKRIVAAATVA